MAHAGPPGAQRAGIDRVAVSAGRIPVVWSDTHRDHVPTLQAIDGVDHPHPEVRSRPRLIREALVEAGLAELIPAELSDDLLVDRVHAPAYRRFIHDACAALAKDEQLTPAGISADPSVLGSDRLAIRASFFAFGTDAPLMRGTYRAARSAVDVALTGATLVANGAPHVLALCRPPGHHAEHDRMGGFCYFNNAVIAAHALLHAGRVAILDVDYHHGNGSQHLTYDRGDILYASLHADPRWAYPGFSGTAVERGSGAGEGLNHNFPLWPGTTIDAYAGPLADACERIAAFAPARLIVSLGFDTHADDPIASFSLRSEDFGRIATEIAALDIPTLHVLEGGYALARLGESVVSYVGALS